MKVVKIDSQDSNMIEQKFFEHAAGKDNIAFLMKDNDIDWSVLQHYINVVEVRFFELEQMKSRLSKKYEPSELKGKRYNFSFDFENETIAYETIA